MNLGIWGSISIVLIITGVTFVLGPMYYQKYKLYQWRSKWKISQNKQLLDTLYHSTNGFALSKKDRVNFDDCSLTYGEICFEPFLALITLCKPDESTIFYDLGSGTGKAVVSIALTFPISRATGLECLPSLANAADSIKDHLNSISGYEKISNIIQFIETDYLQYDWSDGSLVFINASSVFGLAWEAVLQKLDKLKPGTKVITTTKIISSPNYQLCYSTYLLVSWGIVTAYIHIKI